MTHAQPALLAPIPAHGRYLVFGLGPGADAPAALRRLQKLRLPEGTVIGLGEPLTYAAGAAVSGLRTFPGISGVGCTFPATQGAVWISLGGRDAGELLHRGRALREVLGEGFRIEEDVSCFKYGTGRDLSGYEDGTENPKGKDAEGVALVQGDGPGRDGSSFVAWQRYLHDLSRFDQLSPKARDHLIGRHHGTNVELAHAPASAHVKRAAQESFDPEAFMVRRSMPWGGVGEHGLAFVAYGHSLDAFERVLRRMAGLDDGIVDGLLQFTRAVSGGYYWCPPLRGGRLDLRALGL
jgi:putative iron-dependent peroxidase